MVIAFCRPFAQYTPMWGEKKYTLNIEEPHRCQPFHGQQPKPKIGPWDAPWSCRTDGLKIETVILS